MKKVSYVPGTFADIYSLPVGKDMWNLLNSEPVFEKLELTTYLKHPAAEGVGQLLLNSFPDDFNLKNKKYKRLKQCCGHMIKQIMVENGYQLTRPKVKCHINPLFVYAARYSLTVPGKVDKKP